MMLASVLGSSPGRASALAPSGARTLARACSTSATDMDHEKMVQEHSRAAISFFKQSSMNLTAEKPSVTSRCPGPCILAAQSFPLSSTLNSLWTEPSLFVVFIPSA